MLLHTVAVGVVSWGVCELQSLCAFWEAKFGPHVAHTRTEG